MSKLALAPAALLIVLLMTVPFAPAQTLTPKAFYEGKTLRILVGFPPGGGFDVEARLVARHIGRHLPGNPSTIIQNMPGAGGLIQANYMYNVTKPDGLTIALMPHTTVTRELFFPHETKYKSQDFKWLGVVATTVGPIVVRRGSPVTSLEQILNPSAPPLVVGASSREGGLYLGPKLLNRALKAERFKIIAGYSGTPPIRMAMERGEIDGMVFGWGWDSVKATASAELETGELRVIGYWGERREPDLDRRGVPFLPEIITDPEAQTMLRLAMAPFALMRRPWAAPPQTPKELVGILRDAFRKTMEDPKLLAEAKRMDVDVNPVWHDELERKIVELLKSPPRLVAEIRELVGK